MSTTPIAAEISIAKFHLPTQLEAGWCLLPDYVVYLLKWCVLNWPG